MERLINHLHVPSCFDDDDIFLTLSCGSSSSSSSSSCFSSETAAAGMPLAQLAPPRVLRGRRRRRRGQQASSSFDCRTCGREFPTFQALGDHRTSHLRRPAITKEKPRPEAVLVHACTPCGLLGFSTGQALCGHIRRHRGGPSTTTTEEEGCGGPNDVYAVDLARVDGPGRRPPSSRSTCSFN